MPQIFAFSMPISRDMILKSDGQIKFFHIAHRGYLFHPPFGIFLKINFSKMDKKKRNQQIQFFWIPQGNQWLFTQYWLLFTRQFVSMHIHFNRINFGFYMRLTHCVTQCICCVWCYISNKLFLNKHSSGFAFEI